MKQPSRLQALLSSYLTGDIPLYELRGQFYSRDVTSCVAGEEGLYSMVSLHLAYYSVGSWPETVLKDAIKWHMDKENGVDVASAMPMIDRQWVELMDSGIVPWPVQQEVRYIPVSDHLAEWHSQRRQSQT